MLDFALNIFVIGFVVVLMVELIKAPIKVILVKKGLKDNEMASRIFKAVVTVFTYICCFAASLIYLACAQNVDPFATDTFLWYTLGSIGTSQGIYGFLETYGRDGLFVLIKAFIVRFTDKSTADMSKLSEPGLEEFATQILNGINQFFVDAPITVEDLKSILKNTSKK